MERVIHARFACASTPRPPASRSPAQQPELNIVRTAVEAMAAVMGGCQSLHTNSYDEALALPTERAAKIALRTQQIIAHESGAASTADPLGGSYYVEALTDRLEEEAHAYLDRIRQLGGVIPAIRENFFQQEIAEASFQFQSDVDSGERVVVGVNAYQEPEGEPLDLLRIDPELERKQVARVRALRARRETAGVEAAVARIKRDAVSDVNLMPALVAASKAQATVGEMCDSLRDIWGLWRETPVF